MATKAQAGITMTLALATLLGSLGTSIANIALPTLAEAFTAPFAQLQAVIVAYLAAMTISVVIAGRLGDKYGLKSALVGGQTVFAAASVLCAVAPSLWLLIGARTLQGVGAAFLMTLAMALMRQTADEARIGQAMGLLGTASALGTALGPSLGGLLLPVAGWRGIFWVQVPLAVLALLLTVTKLPDEWEQGKTRTAGLWSIIDASLAPSLANNILVAAVMMATLVVGPFYLSIGLGLETWYMGLILAFGPAIAIFSGVPSGRIVDGWGSRHVLAISLVLLMIGALLLAFLPYMMGVVGYLVSIMVLTPGYQLFQAANNTGVLANVPKDRRGMVSGVLNLSRNIGLIAGAWLMGAIFAFGVGTKDFTNATAPDIAAGMRLTFLLASAMILIAIWITFGHSNRRKRPR